MDSRTKSLAKKTFSDHKNSQECFFLILVAISRKKMPADPSIYEDSKKRISKFIKDN